jgi:hypothetical protein
MSATNLPSVIVGEAFDSDAALDALAETVQGLIDGNRNVFGAMLLSTSFVTTTSMAPSPAPREVIRDEMGRVSGIRIARMREAAEENRLDQLKKRLVGETNLRLKLNTNAPITAKEVLECENQTLKHRALVAFGYERFVEEVGAEAIDVDGENSLLRVRGTQPNIMFVYVKDATGDKRYLLRVPPGMQRVREAIAWTFGMTEREYQPEVET